MYFADHNPWGLFADNCKLHLVRKMEMNQRQLCSERDLIPTHVVQACEPHTTGQLAAERMHSQELQFDMELDGATGEEDSGNGFGQGIIQASSLLRHERMDFPAQLLDDVRRMKNEVAAAGYDRASLLDMIGWRLARKGYKVFKRMVTGGTSQSPNCLEKLRHTFLVVREFLPSGGGSTEVIIELNFRDHFVVATHSAKYAELLQTLPDVFVGSMDLLKEVVVLICADIKTLFLKHKDSVPPWRRRGAYLSKWLSQDCTEQEFDLEATQTVAPPVIHTQIKTCPEEYLSSPFNQMPIVGFTLRDHA